MPLKNYESPEEYKDPAAFWRKIGKDYKNMIDPDDKSYKLQEGFLLQFLNQAFYTTKIQSVLELGCGFGRITNHFLNYFRPNDLQVVDCSTDQIMNMIASMKSSIYFIHNFKYHIMDILSPEFEDFVEHHKNSFDLVIAVEFLMHVPEKDIERIVKLMLQLSKKLVINVDWSSVGEYSKGIAAPENFLHPYLDLYKNNGAFQVTRIDIDRIDQSLFYVQKDFF